MSTRRSPGTRWSCWSPSTRSTWPSTRSPAPLLDGEIDTAGYPEYNAIVGGVASHWDEATGDMICRAVVGWGGRGVRGDTDRIGAKLLAGILTNILANQYAHGPDGRSSDPCRQPGGAASSARTAGSPRRTSERSTARSAACACCAADAARRSLDAPLRLRLRALQGRFEVVHGVYADRARRSVRCVAADRSARPSRLRPSTTRGPAGPRRSDAPRLRRRRRTATAAQAAVTMPRARRPRHPR